MDPFLLATGRKFGHYHILELIGRGGMGVVYRARDERLNRDVALKFLQTSRTDDAPQQSRLIREARIASRLNHPHICTIYEADEADGQVYIAMEYVAGHSLTHEIRGGGLPPETVVYYGGQISHALEHAHNAGVVHRDLKTSNVMVTPFGQIKVLDFGLARYVETVHPQDVSTESISSTVAGTLAYIAPEVLRGAMPDPRSDIWALGIILYQLASGRLPFDRPSSAELLSAILRDAPSPFVEGYSEALVAVIRRCLAKERNARYQHAGEVAAALQAIAFAGDLPSHYRPPRTVVATHLVRYRYVLLLCVIVIAVILTIIAIIRSIDLRKKADTQRIDSIAVLPLANMSGDRDQQYLVDGMTEILITDLAKMKAFKRVISRNSAMQYKDTARSFGDIARDLNVDALVTGAVMRSGDRVRITAQLIDPKTDQHLWANEYEGGIGDVFSLERDTALAIAQEVNIRVSPQEQASLTRPRGNQKAHEAYLKGRFYWNKRNLPDLQKSYQFFQSAISEDPTYALAYAGLADYYLALANFGVLEQSKAKAAATRALELDNNLAEAHASLAMAMFLERYRWREAEAQFTMAIQLNPNYATEYQWYAVLLTYLGRLREATMIARRAQELDPLSLIINSYLGYVLYLNREYVPAMDQLKRTIAMDQDFAIAHYFLSRVMVQNNLADEAVTHAERAAHLSPNNPGMTAALAYAYAAAGEKQRALHTLRTLRNSPTVAAVVPDVALAYARLNDQGAAFKALEIARTSGTLWSISLGTEPALDIIRNDKRFAELLKKVGLPYPAP
jgi:eukaryotic-like serine/threonine-protein kinase